MGAQGWGLDQAPWLIYSNIYRRQGAARRGPPRMHHTNTNLFKSGVWSSSDQESCEILILQKPMWNEWSCYDQDWSATFCLCFARVTPSSATPALRTQNDISCSQLFDAPCPFQCASKSLWTVCNSGLLRNALNIVKAGISDVGDWIFNPIPNLGNLKLSLFVKSNKNTTRERLPVTLPCLIQTGEGSGRHSRPVFLALLRLGY